MQKMLTCLQTFINYLLSGSETEECDTKQNNFGYSGKTVVPKLFC